LAGEAIPSTKIENLTVAKLTGGVINATETITSEGVIRAVDDINTPTVQTGIGPTVLTVNGSSVTSLMWSFNAAGVTFSIDELGNPFFSGTIAASGFTNDELTIDELGNVDSTGTFRFGGVADNFVDFNGTQLVIDTDNFSVDGSGFSFGDVAAGESIEFDGTTLTLGSAVTIGDNTDRTITVGSSGDYTTINAALEALSRTVPAYKSGGFVATIEVEAGHVVSDQIIVDGVNLRWITIKTADDSPISVDGTSIGSTTNWFVCSGGSLSPKIDFSTTIINGPIDKIFNVKGNSSLSFVLRSAARITIEANQSNYGIYAEEQSLVFGERLAINDLDNEAIVCTEGSDVQAFSLNVDGCSGGIKADLGGRVEAQVADISNATGDALAVLRNGSINASSSTLECTGATGSEGVHCDAGTINIAGSLVSGWDVYGLYSSGGGKIIAEQTTCQKTIGGSNSSDDVKVDTGSIIVFNSGTGGVSKTKNTLTGEGIIFEN
jgi:hypothetical protein